jgi:hypothetical protein
MKHLLLCIASLFNRHPAPKPPLDVKLLDRTVSQLNLPDPSKTVCVYPASKK